MLKPATRIMGHHSHHPDIRVDRDDKSESFANDGTAIGKKQFDYDGKFRLILNGKNMIHKALEMAKTRSFECEMKNSVSKDPIIHAK